MDYLLTETQELLSRSAREFLAAECPKSLVREVEKSPAGYSPEIWSKAVGLGWSGLPFQSEIGGGDGTWMDFALLAEEIGRGVAPIPYLSSTIGATAALSIDPQKGALIAGAASRGEGLTVLALNEESATFLPDDIHLSAVRSGDGWKLNGLKLFVSDASAATSFLVIARTGDGPLDLTAFVVDAPDVRIELDETTAGDQLGALFFDDVVVADLARLGEINRAWPGVERALAIGQIGLAAYTLGLAQQALEMAVDYAKSRVQFGVPIGSFQALQHKMADRSTEIDGLRYLVYHAAWNADIGAPFEQDARKAKTFAGMICRQTALDCAHMFGGYGMVVETDVQLYYRRLRMSEVRFGQHDEMLESIAVGLGL